MPGGKGNIRPEDGKQFSSEYQPQETWTEDTALQLGKELIQWLVEKDERGRDKKNIFFKEFLLIEKDLNLDVIGYLKDKFTSFAELLNKAKEIQELKLVKYGVNDKLNASMTKFVLANHHGYKERRDLTTDDKPLTEEIDYSKLSDKALEEIAKLKPEQSNS